MRVDATDPAQTSGVADAGDELVIGFDCTQGTQTLPAWAADNGYTVTEFERTGDAAWTITVRK